MLRPLISYLFIVSLLFMGIESTMDSVSGEHPHGGDNTHLADSDDATSTDTKDDAGHCQNCCHGHTSSISEHPNAISCDAPDQSFSFYQPSILNFAQAPPTPPPNV